MICVACRRRHHRDCPGGTWCDCQHQPRATAAEAGAEPAPDASPGQNAEPALSWLRQG